MTGIRSILRIHALSVAAFAMVGCASGAAQTVSPDPETAPAIEAEVAPVELFDVEIVAQYPHDDAAFTQGLLWHDGYLYESTGREGISTVRQVDLESGDVLVLRDIPADQFGEGLALWDDQLISLTWHHGIVHRWNLSDLSLIESQTDFPFESWGLTTLGEQLVLSDGSSTLRFLNAETLAVEREVTVTLDGGELDEINELEVIDGEIFANIWFTRLIVAINPETGAVTKIINLRPVTDLMTMVDTNDGAVLNGIAYDADNDRLFVTGKLWPTLFEIRLVPQVPIGPNLPVEGEVDSEVR